MVIVRKGDVLDRVRAEWQRQGGLQGSHALVMMTPHQIPIVSLCRKSKRLITFFDLSQWLFSPPCTSPHDVSLKLSATPLSE